MRTIRLDNGDNRFFLGLDDPEEAVRVLGLGGNDTISGSRFGDIVLGGEGNDDVFGVSGNDELIAGSGKDFLAGMGGNDTLAADGLAADGGIDSLDGGEGDDTYIISVGNAFRLFSVTEQRDPGEDLLQIEASVDITDFLGLENVSLIHDSNSSITGNQRGNILTGNIGRNAIAGGAGWDSITGGAGNDTLNGQSGNDTMRGGIGDDHYFVDEVFDHTIERSREGHDVVTSSANWVLTPNTEDLVLTGHFGLRGTGNASANLITGSNFRNVLNGGDGLDTLDGGEGNDSYVLDDISLFRIGGQIAGESRDRIIDAAGIDTVYVGWLESLLSTGASKSYKLGAGIEEGVVTGRKVFDLQGNTLDNALAGNIAANNLAGGVGDDTLNGGRGADTLAGGTGWDHYFLNDAADRNPSDGILFFTFDGIEEEAGGGLDTVHVGRLAAATGDITNYTLGANVENGIVTGDGDFNMGGNELSNVLTGNDAANTMGGGIAGDDELRGQGGADVLDGGSGSDTMNGGGGNDFMSVDNAGDRVIEGAGQGNDTVIAFISHTLADNVEILGLVGSANLQGIGNALGNVITGQLGANTLSGLGGEDSLKGFDGSDLLIGGAGKDELTGGSGADRFRMNVLADNASADVFVDYSPVDDVIEMEGAVFTGLGGPGVLQSQAFRIGGAATNLNHRIMYNNANGQLIYDSNGSAGGGAVLLATLATGLPLTNADILIV